MPAPLLRRSLWALGVAALLLVVAVAALPYFASTRIVRDRIADEIGDWSGLSVSIGEHPQIAVWPRFQAVLTDVSMSLPNDPAALPVLTTERMEISLSAFAALSGNAEFSTARLVRPTLRVAQSASGMPTPVLTGKGRIGRSIALARSIVAQDRVTPDTARMPSDRFGIVSFSDGRIVTGEKGDIELLTGITGTVDWASLNGQAKISGTGVWRGETFSAEVTAARPLLMLGGGETSLKVAFKSAPATLSFDGKASLAENAYFEGDARFSTPSMLRTIEWTQADILHGTEIGAASIVSRVTGSGQRIRFEEAEITLDGNPGSGVLDLLLNGNLPVITGTLAFDSLDIGSFLSAFTPLKTTPGSGPGTVDGDFASQLNLDLRLSARQATAGSLKLADVAATARVNDGFAAFDISDAKAFGGNVQTGLRFDRKPEATQVELRLLASDIDGGAFGAAAGIARLVPVGRGTVSVIVKGQGSTWDALIAHSNGSIAASFGRGTLPGLDMEQLVKRLGEGESFALEEVSGGSFPIEAMDVKASVADGVATIETAQARSELRKIVLSGTVPYEGGNLTLSGRIAPAVAADGQEDAETGAIDFLVGGRWSAPHIAPAAGGQAAE